MSRKRTRFAQLRNEYEIERTAGRMPAAYDAWFEQDLNNATLAAVATYRQWVPALRYRIATRGLTDFYADVAALAELDAEERAQQLALWNRTAR